MPIQAIRELPKGARVYPDVRLMTWRPRGLLDAALARRICLFLEAEEASAAEPFHRFADLSAVSAIHLSAVEVEELARVRSSTYHGPEIRTAILAYNPFAFGIAGMYERLMRRSPIQVRVFCRLTSAAAWLNRPIEILLIS